jgi:hypothetical protein
MDLMRGMTREEAAAYKRLKSRIFTRVSRGKEGVMDGIESFHCPLCKCKTTVDFTSHLVEKDATLATLTAERDRLTARVKRIEKELYQAATDSFADETAIRDALRPILGGTVVDGDAKGVPPLEDLVIFAAATIAELREQIQGADHADRKLDDLLGSLAGVEGQVVSVQTAKLLYQENQELKATIATFTAQRDAAHEDVRALAEAIWRCQNALYFEATDTLGEWKNRFVNTPRVFQEATVALSRPTVRKIMEGT